MAQRKAKFLVEAEDGTRTAMQSVERNLGRVNSAAERVASTFQSVFLASMAVSFGKAMIEAATDAEQASNRMTAVLRATGSAAGFAKSELDEMADSLAGATQFDDESIRNAQSTLLKFGVIQEQVFTRALKLSADYAAFMGTQIPDAAQQIGKALASPVEGLGTLERQIGKISPSTRQMIEDLVQAGDVMKAQTVILDLLKDRIGGTAEAMNTGLTKATGDAKKAWDEMLESLGKTAVVQKSVEGSLEGVATDLTRIKGIIESGTWTEKLFAIFANTPQGRAASAMASAFGADLPGLSKGADGDAAARAAADKAAKNNPPSMIDWEKGYKNQQDAIKKSLDASKHKSDVERQLREKGVRDAEWAAQKIEDGAEEARKVEAEAWSFVDKATLASTASMLADRALMMKQVYEHDADESKRDMDREQTALLAVADKVDILKDSAHELGLTFSSAFEEAIFGGKGLRDVLGGLAMDVAKIVVRKTVTQPLADGVTGFIKGIDFGGIFDGVFGGGKAEGGGVSAGVSYLVGERGPERFTPDSNGTITPNSAMGAINITMNQHFGSDVDHATLRAWGEQVKQESVAAVADARMRGGAYAGAFRG